MDTKRPEEDAAVLKAKCPRRLSGHRPVAVRERLAALAALPEAELGADTYGDGGAVAVVEETVAGLLGKPACIFLPKGIIAQLAVLRTWSENRGRVAIGLHPQSHIEVDEGGAYSAIHGLRGVRLGADGAPFGASDLVAVREKLAAVVVELPLRRCAFQMPDWSELLAMVSWCDAHGSALHMDGARLWECGPGYGRSYPEICEIFDSVYVSFYKGLGGLGGAAIAGGSDFIAETRIWLHRQGAHPYRSYPYALAALEGLRRHLPKMGDYHARAVELSEALRTAGLRTTLAQTNSFQVWLPISASAAVQGQVALARARGVWLLERVIPTVVPSGIAVEVQIGEAAEDLGSPEIITLFEELISFAQAA